MNFIVLTIFPELVQTFWENGILRRAMDRGTIKAQAINIRDFAAGRHKVTDDRPYGGGCGMVMKPEPLSGAIRQAKAKAPAAPVIYMSPQGRRFDQAMAGNLAAEKELIVLCGRYEGIDQRIADDLIDAEISIGDYVLTGGEIAAIVLMDAVTRLIPGALGNEDSAQQDSFSGRRLDHAHYTRPPAFGGSSVPEVLQSGHHDNIRDWRQRDALMRTLVRRPDLLRQSPLSDNEIRMLKTWRRDIDSLLGQ